MVNLKHAALLAALLVAACSSHVPRAAAEASPVGVASHEDAHQSNTPQIAADATQPTFTFVDPHTGKLLLKAQARSGSLQSGSAASSVIGTLYVVNGVLYQNGVAADHFTAETVKADQAKQLMTASGGVLVRSISDPATSIRCDRVTWNAKTNLMLGSGHVLFKKGGFTQTGPSFQADTKLRRLVMPAPKDHGEKIKATFTTL